jgi:hypothetical protein
MRPNCAANLSAADASKDEPGLVVPAAFLLYASVQAVVTGTSTGTLNVQFSNDLSPGVDSNGNPAPTNWSNIATVGTVSISGAGVYSIPVFQVGYQWLRLQFVHNNGASGTISANLNTIGF